MFFLNTFIKKNYDNAQRSTLNAQRSTLNAQRSTLNAQRSTLNAQQFLKFKKLFLLTSFLFFMLSHVTRAQENSFTNVYSGVWIGCAEGQNPDRKTFEEYINEGLCLRQCKNNRGNFFIYSYPYPPTNTVWTVTGGVIQTQDADDCKIVWGVGDTGSITVSTVVNGVTISYPTLCVDLKKSPSSSFTVAPATQPLEFQPYQLCTNQTLYLNDLSITNGGTPINNRYWDFGDGTFSSEINASHVYQNDGTYTITNFISNECNCNSESVLTVEVKNKSVDITCPSVICEGDIATYSIGEPFGANSCTAYNWSVNGGTIVSTPPYTSNLDVQWNTRTITDGFGYVTFNPTSCNAGCYAPTTVKVPIIKSDSQPIVWEGALSNTILNTSATAVVPVCGITQQKFKMPQWPSTEFNWEITNTSTVPPTTANYILTDQRNEILLNPGTTAGTITLKCTYFNTLLKCGGIATRQISISQSVTIDGPDTACLTEPTNYSSSGGAGVTWKYRLLPNGVPTGTYVGETYQPVFPSAGQYEILLSTTNSCGSTSKPVTVVGVPTLLANQLVGSTTICQGTPSNFSINNTVPNTVIGWQVTNGTITGSNYGNSITANFNNANPAIYNLTVWRESTLAPFCKSAITTIPLLPTIIDTSILGAIAPCGSTTAIYTNPTTDADNLEWSVVPSSAGNIVSGINTNSVQVLWNEAIPGQSPSIRLKISKCNRTVVAALPVTISNPQFVLSTPLQTFCGGVSQPFTLTAATPLTAGTVTWNFGDNITQTTLNNVFTTNHVFNNATSSNASYTVTATIASPNGCNITIIKTIMVTVKPSPIASITPSVNKCGATIGSINISDRTLTLNIQNSNGVTIQWYKNNIPITGATAANYIATTFGTYYAIVDNGICAKTTNMIAFVYCNNEPPLCTVTPTPNITATISNSCGAITASATYAGTALSKKWVDVATNAILSTTNAMTATVTEPGNYLYNFEATFTSTSGQPCVFTKLTTIIVPYIVDLKTNVTCPSTTAGQYNVTMYDFSKIYAATPITSWQFYVNNVLKTKNTVLGDLDTNRHITLAPGTYTLKLVVGSVGQASCTKTITLVLPAFPTAVITAGGGTTCPENAMQFTTATQTGCTYEWTIKKNTDLNYNANNLRQNPTLTFAASTTLSTIYSVSLKVTNSIGCSALSSNIFVTIPAVNLSGILPPSMAKCQGETASILYSPAPSTNPVVSYQWMNNNQPVPPPAGTANPLITNTQGAYWVKIGNASGCKVPIINPKCTVTFAAQNVSIAGVHTFCLNNPVRLTAAIAGGSISSTSNATYEWHRNDVSNVISTEAILEDIPAAVGNYTYTLTLLTPSGAGSYCTSTATHTVTVVQEPTVTAFYDSVTCDPYSFALHATADMPGTFNWSNGQTGADLTTSFGGSYKVLFTSANGCTATAQLQTPRSPESYLWEFPSGCYRFCNKIDYQRSFIGPSLAQFQSGWVWNAAATAPAVAPTISGINTMTPYNLPILGGNYSYAMLLYGSPECSYQSKPANVQFFSCNNSASCRLHTFTQNATNPLQILSSASNPYLYYQLKFNFLPGAKVISLANLNNDGIFVPSTINVPAAGLNDFIIKFIPNTLPYVGPIHVALNSFLHGDLCETDQYILIANTPSARTTTGLLAGFGLDLIPNPAKSSVNITYTFVDKNALKTIAIYDLMGRLLKQKVVASLKDVWEVPLDDVAAGQYIAVMKEGENVVMQKNLLKTD